MSMPTMQYRIRFHRYRNGQSRLSAPVWHNAVSFRAAVDYAEGMLYGMEQADPDSRFVIADIVAWGLRGEECDGAHLFETAEELSARVAEQAK